MQKYIVISALVLFLSLVAFFLGLLAAIWDVGLTISIKVMETGIVVAVFDAGLFLFVSLVDNVLAAKKAKQNGR